MTPKLSIWFKTNRHDDPIGSSEMVILFSAGAASGSVYVPFVDVPPFEDTASMMESDWIKPFVAEAKQKCVDECKRMWQETFDSLRPDHV